MNEKRSLAPLFLWAVGLSTASILAAAGDGLSKMRRIDLKLVAKISDAAREFQKLVIAAGAKAKFVDGSCQAVCDVAVQAAYALQSAIVELRVQTALAPDLQSPCRADSLAHYGAGFGLALFAGQ